MQHKGKVCRHVDAVILNKVKFSVQRAGRARVLRERQKNIHAFVDGELMTWELEEEAGSLLIAQHVGADWKLVTYNPYAAGYFFQVATREPIKSATQVIVIKKLIWVRQD